MLFKQLYRVPNQKNKYTTNAVDLSESLNESFKSKEYGNWIRNFSLSLIIWVSSTYMCKYNILSDYIYARALSAITVKQLIKQIMTIPVKSSHIKIPKDQTSDFELNLEKLRTSGAAHFMGNFPPTELVYSSSKTYLKIFRVKTNH